MAKGQILQTIIDISGEISPTLGKALGEVGKKLENVNLKAVAAGAAVGGIAIGTVAMVGKATKALAKLGDEYNTAMNDIAASTGLAGEELAEMGDVMKDVYASNFGESMEDVASGIAEIHKQTGLVEEELVATTKGAYALADTFGYDVAESARAAKAMMTNFGVSGEEAMGLIAAGAQDLITRESLSTAFPSIQFSLQSSASLPMICSISFSRAQIPGLGISTRSAMRSRNSRFVRLTARKQRQRLLRLSVTMRMR